MNIDYIEVLDQLALWLQNVDSQTLLGGVFSLLGATVLLSMAVRYFRARKGDATASQSASLTGDGFYESKPAAANAKSTAKPKGSLKGSLKGRSKAKPADKVTLDGDDRALTGGASSASEPGGSLELILRQQRLIDSLAERVQALEGYLEMMSSRQQKSEAGHRDRLYYQDAIRAAKSGANAEELAEQYNLPAAEANLIISLSAGQARAA